MSACLKALEFMRMRYEQYRSNFEEYKLRCPLSLYSTLKLPRSMIFLVALQPNSNTKYEQNTKVDFILVEISQSDITTTFVFRNQAPQISRKFSRRMSQIPLHATNYETTVTRSTFGKKCDFWKKTTTI